jgi:hypothetical protein
MPQNSLLVNLKTNYSMLVVSPRPIEAYSHNQNLAESAIRDLRPMYRKALRLTNAPLVLWDHCMKLMAAIRSHTALNVLSLQGETPHTVLTGDTGDISQLCEFSWYDIVWYIDITVTMQNRKLGRYLGPSPDIGQAMSSKILAAKGTVIVQTSILPLSIEDNNSDVVRTQIQDFDKALTVALGDRIVGIPAELDENEEDDRQFVPYADDVNGEEPVMPESDLLDHDTYHRFIAARVQIPVGGEMKSGTVIK